METYNREEMYKRDVNLYMEANPNPNSLKFVANYMLVNEGASYDFPNAESADQAPLAKELFAFDFVERVFYMSNFVTVTKKPEVEWIEVQDQIRNFITDYLQQEKPLLLEEELESTEENNNQASTDIESKIKNVLEEYVKPAVEMDGGAIQFHSFENGIVTLLLQGACSGCPSSTITLKSGIENLLKRMVPEVEEVVAEGV
ncbi:MAG: iron transporter [Cyclobacteriaceae bacterium]|nr:MAG: iron transporter [Cyclobacteriaceae bacterium]